MTIAKSTGKRAQTGRCNSDRPRRLCAGRGSSPIAIAQKVAMAQKEGKKKRKITARKKTKKRKDNKSTNKSEGTGRYSEYPQRKKAGDENKTKCNRLIAHLAAESCTHAVVLDTSHFKTTKSILEHPRSCVREVVCPQRDESEFNRMRSGLSRNRGLFQGRVSVKLSTMSDVVDSIIRDVLHTADSKLIVWHDAMGTWNSEVHGEPSIHRDVSDIVRTFAESPAQSMTLAVTVCTRVKVSDTIFLGKNRDVVSGNITNMINDMSRDMGSRNMGIHSRIIDSGNYPQMYFIAVELSRYVPRGDDSDISDAEKRDGDSAAVADERCEATQSISGAAEEEEPRIEDNGSIAILTRLKGDVQSMKQRLEKQLNTATESRDRGSADKLVPQTHLLIDLSQVGRDGVRVMVLWDDGEWYAGTLKRYRGRKSFSFYVRYEREKGGNYVRYHKGSPDHTIRRLTADA